MLTYFQFGRITGPQFIGDQIALIGQGLDGRAKEWFEREVLDPGRERAEWDLGDLIGELYERFVNVTNVHAPTVKYEALKYSSDSGVLDFANNIEHYAKRMVDHPNPYEMKRKFLAGLPTEIARHLLLDKQLSAELSSFRTLRDTALAYETGQKFLDQLTKSSGKTTTNANGEREAKENTNRPTCPLNHRGRFTPRSHTEPQVGEAGKANPRPNIGLHTKETNRPTGNQKEGAHHVPRVSQTGNRNRDAKGGNWIPSKEWKANVTCHACKGKGHYASDAECPMYGKPRPQGQRQLYAGAVMEDGEHRENDEPSSNSAETGLTTQSMGEEHTEEIADDTHSRSSDGPDSYPGSDSDTHYHEGWQWDSDEEPLNETDSDEVIVYPHVMAMRVDEPGQTEVNTLEATPTDLHEPDEVVLDESIDERDYFDFMPELTKDEIVRFARRIEKLENEVPLNAYHRTHRWGNMD
ncbi:hypothetical protein K488DRAFT_92429 [Vararia minispora EC-137]|uniref:Uncharacterized protein n=1 Tax=Vararia minispora EC-137 TaxID=1314806 RepID=A0ACB8Q435_9AGAM|nr:hypothetical protein K488DRAFT_92429 [Vararia minispora EC-137]